MKFLRILPEICASTICPFDSFSRNIVPGKTSTTIPSVTIDSSFGTGRKRLLAEIRFEINPSHERSQSLASLLMPRKRRILHLAKRTDSRGVKQSCLAGILGCDRPDPNGGHPEQGRSQRLCQIRRQGFNEYHPVQARTGEPGIFLINNCPRG